MSVERVGIVILYHFTDLVGYRGIDRDRVIRPNSHRFFPYWRPVVWLTDLAHPERCDLGLFSDDLPHPHPRMAIRFSVDIDDWISFADARRRWWTTLGLRAPLDAYGKHGRWFVSVNSIDQKRLLGVSSARDPERIRFYSTGTSTRRSSLAWRPWDRPSA